MIGCSSIPLGTENAPAGHYVLPRKKKVSPLRGAEVGFLDDLFVDPEQRGSGAAEALLRSVDDIAAERGWPVVRWITRDNNYRARGLYDRLSHRSDWITYEMTAASIGRG